MKKIGVLVAACLLIVMVVSLVPLGCTETPATVTSTVTSTAASTSTSVTTVSKPLYTIKWNCSDPITDYAYTTLLWWQSEVNRKTGNRVAFENYWSGALGAAAVMGDGLKAGVYQMAKLVAAFSPTKFPLGNMWWICGINPSDYKAALRASVDVATLQPDMVKEFDSWDAQVLFMYGTLPTDMGFMSKVPVTTLAELGGLRLRASGQIGVAFDKMGAKTISMAAGEVYDAATKGTIDGSIGAVTMMTSYSLQNVWKNLNILYYGYSVQPYCIKKSYFQSLPADIQKIMLEVSGPEYEYQFWNNVEAEGLRNIQRMKAAGVTINQMQPADLKQFQDVGGKYALDTWIADSESKGLPAKKVSDYFLERIDYWSKQMAAK